jgi:hypothetical protein
MDNREMETGCKKPLEPMHSCCVHPVADKGYDVSLHQCCVSEEILKKIGRINQRTKILRILNGLK